MKKLIDICNYLLGNYRYKLYYNERLVFLMRDHIYEQIAFRISVMDRDCYHNGECKKCGCSTTALQMANKACGKPCYPAMMNKKRWNKVGKVFIRLHAKNPEKYERIVNEYERKDELED